MSIVLTRRHTWALFKGGVKMRDIYSGRGVRAVASMSEEEGSTSQKFRREIVCRMPNGQSLAAEEMEPLAKEANYSCATLANLCGISLRQLQRRFYAYHGETLGQWLNRIRLKHAYAQLAHGNTVKETTFSLGYKQVSHFSRLFKQYYGITPSTVSMGIRVECEPGRNGATQLCFF